MTTLTELIETCTKLIQKGGFLMGFFLILIEAFIPILPLGAFVTLNINAFGTFPGLLISWSASVIGSYICIYYVTLYQIR